MKKATRSELSFFLKMLGATLWFLVAVLFWRYFVLGLPLPVACVGLVLGAVACLWVANEVSPDDDETDDNE